MNSTKSTAIRLHRRLLELTQAELAARVGCSRPYLSRLERGHRPLTPQIAARLSSALGIEVSPERGL